MFHDYMDLHLHSLLQVTLVHGNVEHDWLPGVVKPSRVLLVDFGSADGKTFLSWAKRIAMTVTLYDYSITFKNNRRNKIKIENYGSGMDKYPIESKIKSKSNLIIS